MKVREIRESDLAVLREIHQRGAYGFDFPDPQKFIETAVVLDDMGCPIMAAAAKLSPELVLICAPGGSEHPLVKLKGIALLHEQLRDKLVARGYQEANAFLAPQMERSFGRHLQRHFGWKQSWTGYTIRDWKGGS